VADVVVKEADWESIVGAVLKNDTDDLNQVLDRVDQENELRRYYLYIKWQDGDVRRPGPDDPIEDWPPWVFDWFTSYEPFTAEWVREYVARRTSNAIYILVTDDPSGEVGWYELEEFSFS